MNAPLYQPSLFAEPAPPTPPAVTLRAYQKGAVEWVDGERAPGRRILLVAATGAGKTLTSSQIMLNELARGGRVIFAAHRQELIAQTYGAFLRLGLPEHQLGVIMGEGFIQHPITKRRVCCARAHAPVQIASIDTLRNRLDTAKPAGITMIFIDEAHRALAKGYRKLVDAYPEAVTVGLTATPWRGDGRGLGDLFERLHAFATPRLLMDQGYLVEPRVFSHPKRADVSKVATVAGDYDQEQLAEACDKRELLGSIVEHWKRHLEGVRTVAFAVSVAHSQHIVEEFLAAGIPAEHLDGETPDDERAAIFGRLERGETLVLSNVGVCCEGWDMPAVKGCILACPTKSLAKYIQCAGRILRPWEGVKIAGFEQAPDGTHRPIFEACASYRVPAIILDHAGCVLEHGLPQEDREYSLEGRKKRAKATVSVKECPICFGALPCQTRVCVYCGHAFVATSAAEGEPLAERDGQLVEVKVDSLRALQRQTQAARHELQDWAGRVDRTIGMPDGSCNGLCKRKFRKSRSEMGPDELDAVRAWFLAQWPWLLDAPAPEPEPSPARRAPLRFEAPVAEALW